MTQSATEILAAEERADALRLIPSAPPAEEADAVDFLRASGLPLSSVVLGLLDQSDDCIKIIGLDGTLQFMNCNGKKVMQIDDFSAIAGAPWTSLWPEPSRTLIGQAVATGLGGRINRFEASCPTAKGEPRWWEVTVSPVRAPTGDVVALLSTSRDISDRRQREEAAATVALEMRHRLRNAHSVGAALLLASGKVAPAHQEFARDVAGRLALLSDIHARLVDDGGGIALATLCDDVAQVFEHSGGQLQRAQVPDLHLHENHARVVSLILGELTTNSLKHGALGRGGEAEIDARVEDNTLTLHWRERFSVEQKAVRTASSGQGAELMSRIARLYRGSIETGPDEHGYYATLTLPL